MILEFLVNLEGVVYVLWYYHLY